MQFILAGRKSAATRENSEKVYIRTDETVLHYGK